VAALGIYCTHFCFHPKGELLTYQNYTPMQKHIMGPNPIETIPGGGGRWFGDGRLIKIC